MNIVITGANGGIGRAVAETLAEGNTMVLHGFGDAGSLAAVADAVCERGGTAEVVLADLSRQSGCLEVVDCVERSFSSVDVLINNAGSPIELRSLSALDRQFLEHTFAVNVFHVVELTRLLMDRLRDGTNPCVVNTSSVAIRWGAPGIIAYTAAKGAVDSLTRALANELSPHVRVNAVAPGVIDSGLHEKLGNQSQVKTMVAKTPLGRTGLPEEVAAAVRFLIDNTFVTGETIDVNGGVTMR